MQIQDELEQHRRDAEYFQAHRQELLERYPELWVAVYHEEVVAAAKDLKRLRRQLEHKGVPAGRVFRDYLTDREELLIVPATG